MSKGTVIALVIAGVLVTAGLVLGAVATANGLSTTDTRYTKKVTTVDSTVTALTVLTADENVRILPASDGACRVEAWESDKLTFAVETDGTTLTVREIDNRTWLDRVGLHFGWLSGEQRGVAVYLPGALDTLTVETSSGSVRAENQTVRGAASIKTTSASIRIDTLQAGSLTATATSGSIRLYHIQTAGKVEANGVSGSVTLEDVQAEAITVSATSGSLKLSEAKADGAIEVKGASGSITVEDAACRALTATATSGSVRVRGSRAASDPTEIGATSGSVTVEDCTFRDAAIHATSGSVRVNDTTAGDLHLNAKSGSVHFENLDASSLTIKATTGSVSGSLAHAMRFDAHATTGSVSIPASSGDAPCTIETTSGSIRVTVKGE
ncbi:MAG: DUF4097 family beta strand repeat protein [Clostridia bacterium]|nr:DUF4097 family beta strand repeat protein [Clostridia bacterium]